MIRDRASPSHPDSLATPDEASRLQIDLDGIVAFAQSCRSRIARSVVGSDSLTSRLLIALLCEGSVLLEGAPGLGKTLLARNWADMLGLDFRRIQFTPDLMPLDILGTSMPTPGAAGGFTFYRGPIFAHVVLADEINRATPKTQSAFLEAMEERRVSFLGTTYGLPRPFFVLATQNPIELEGTYPLPEAQLDRFLMKLTFNPPDFRSMVDILAVSEREDAAQAASADDSGADRLRSLPESEATADAPPDARSQSTLDFLHSGRTLMTQCIVPSGVRAFVARLAVQTQPAHTSLPAVKQQLRYGASPRAAVSLLRAAKAKAVLGGRIAVAFEDAIDLAPECLLHRLVPDFESASESNLASLLQSILDDLATEYGLMG